MAWLVVAVVLACCAAYGAGRIVEARALDALHAATAADAKLRAALLDSEVARYRLLPLALAGDHDVASGVAGPRGTTTATALDRKLAAMAGATGAPVIYVVAPDGRAVAASNWATPSSFVGRDYRFRPYYRDARRTGAGEQFARGTVSGRPGLYLSNRTPGGGVTVVKLEFDGIEREWARAGGITSIADGSGVVLVSSRPDWRFAMTRPLSAPAMARFRALASLPAGVLHPSPVRPDGDGRGVTVGGARFVAATAPTRQRGWTLTLLSPLTPALGFTVRIARAAAAAIVLLLCGLLWLFAGRRARRRHRTAELEAAVAQRTIDLEREIKVRAASEARAADLREGLRQANRLASLGQITASVAHETAQPVAAIRTYAQTSAVLLDRGDATAVRDNLATIARLADRIGNVTSELRGFSRRNTRELRPIRLAEAIDGAMLILRDQLKTVAIAIPAIDPAFEVVGGRIRLEQVIVNLLQNAAEALRDVADPRIDIRLEADADTARLTIADNGPGIPADLAARLFTPFVTTRETGLGLGLVIAQDIMEESGGALRLLPTTGGAAFEIAMRRR